MPEERLHREPGQEYAEADTAWVTHEAGLGESLAIR